MPPETRSRSYSKKLVIERESESEDSSSEDEVEADEDEGVSEGEERVSEQEEEEESVPEKENGVKMEESLDSEKKGKVPITLSLRKVCQVCKKEGHEAGFRGATYIDCPMKPCFLCKLPGHTTMTCPHRVATEHGVIPAPRRKTLNSFCYVVDRQLRSHTPRIKLPYVIPDEVSCGVKKYHSSRVTCLEFHPTYNNILLSGDKKGKLGIWHYDTVHEMTVYGNIHSCILNNMRFNLLNDGTVYSAASDGTMSCTDLECGICICTMDLNPRGWQGQSTWRMLYGLDINLDKGLVLVADNFGFLYMVDTRSHDQTGDPILIHKKGTKVVGLHCNPLQPDLLLSCGNDHFARLWDVRHLKAGSALSDLSHKRVVNSAYFSPISGSKIVTTSQDNRIRVWDSIYGNLDFPSREIVHSHDFNRHLSPFRAEWDPKDPSESLVVIGRYISENYSGTALHPIDFIDTSTGQLVAEVMDPEITTITPVNKLHPRDDLLASGSSRSLFIWRPKGKSELEEKNDGRKTTVLCEEPGKKKGNKKSKDDSDDSESNDTQSLKGKKAMLQKRIKSKA